MNPMIPITRHYEEIKEGFLSMFDRLVSEGFVPLSTGRRSYTVADVDAFRKDLTSGRYIISVCGQINAGKSTFLNFLVFGGRPILPEAATPWTAKLTHISYGAREQARVCFYSRAEWESVKE